MEHPFKRRKLELGGNQPARHYGFRFGRGRSGSLTEKKEIERIVVPQNELLSHEDQAFDTLLRFPRQKIQQLYDPLKSSESGHGSLQTRGLVPTSNTNVPAQANNVVRAAAQPISTVVNVAVSNGEDIVSNVVVPLASTPVAIPGFSDLTMSPIAAPSSTNENPPTANKVDSSPGDVTPPAALAASIARAIALQTQQAIAHELDALPPGPASSAIPENRAAASHVSMAINVPGSSQQVLSSPSTPIPSTPQSSNSPSSYFSPSPASVSTSSSPTSNPPTPSPTLSSSHSQMTSSNNSTTSVTSLSGSGISASMSMTSLNSEASALSASLFAQASASQASLSSVNALAALLSGSQTSSGFATATRTSEDISSITSGQTSSSNSLTLSASSQISQSSTSTPFPSTTTSGLGVGGFGGPSNTGSTSSPTSSSGAGSGGSSALATPQIVGTVIGGVAGLAMILFLILALFRWRRKKMGQRRNISPPIPQTFGPGGVPQTGTMTQRSSTAPIAGAGFFGRLRPVSSQTAATAATTETAPSERGFQKLSGRKLTSVLHSRGDGFNEPVAAAGPSTAAAGPSDRGVTPGQGPIAGLAPTQRPSPPHSLSGSSFYRDSQGFYGGVVPANDQSQMTETSSSPSSSPTYPAPLAIGAQGAQGRGSPSGRGGEALNMRPGPARTPIINEPAVIPNRTPSRATPPGRPVRNAPPPITDFPRVRDGLGRSHPSQDGSRGSRFREDTTPP